MEIIELKSGAEVQIDNDDYSLISRHNWYIDSKGYAVTSIATKRVKMHRIIFGKVPPGMTVDHINRNKLDNRKCNLRAVKVSENTWNTGVCDGTTQNNPSSNYVGIRKRKRKNGSHYFEASCMLNNKDIYIGRSDNEIEAAKMRDAFVYKVRGDFSYLNFPDNVVEYVDWNFPNRLLRHLK